MRGSDRFRHRQGERGQTILLIAAALVSLLAMAALAIDVVTLYVARTECQRAADTAALAAAKGIADSGITTLQTSDTNYAAAQTLAQAMATAGINAVLQTNQVSGQQPSIVGSPAPVYTHPNNPYITVKLQVSNLPTFFARVWGKGASSVTASATAEVYNPSNATPYTPVTPSSVKPWLLANKDLTSNPFIDEVSGAVTQNYVGTQFDIQADCEVNPIIPGCTLAHIPFGSNPGGAVDYVPAQVTANAANVCPSACAGSTAFEQSIACADVNPYQCGGTTPNANWDSTINPVSSSTHYSANGAECLIHVTSSGAGQGQDQLTVPGSFAAPPQILGGTYSPAPTQLVSTSNSIVTIPIVDTSVTQSNSAVTIVGFMQAFINWVEPNDNINITILNISACGQTQNGSNGVVGGSGSSPVPVRLITPPSS